MQFSILITSVEKISVYYEEGYNWKYHLTNIDFQGWEGYKPMGSFIRGDFRFSVFCIENIEPKPTVENLQELARREFDYLNNPFGLPEGKE